jgi:hypothetical protein
MEKKFTEALIVVITVIVALAILTGTNDTVTRSIYKEQAHNVTLSDNTVIETPAPLLGVDVQMLLWSLAPVGVVIFGGLALFYLFMKKH